MSCRGTFRSERRDQPYATGSANYKCAYLIAQCSSQTGLTKVKMHLHQRSNILTHPLMLLLLLHATPLPSANTQFSPFFPSDDEELLFPTLANGHLGFTVFGDAIYMNGLYNGHRGLSHRARIANIANIRLSCCDHDGDGGNQPPSSSPPPTSSYSMDFETGTFRVDYRGPNNSFRVAQLIYPHQLYNRAVVNQFTIERITDGGGL